MEEKVIEEKRQGEALELPNASNSGRKMYIESYGCQMNFSDSEIVASILIKEGFSTTHSINEADLVFVNTCSIREKAEQTIRKRLEFYNSIKKKENPKTTSAPKSDVIDVKAELKKFKEMLDDGLIEQEDYDAKKKELLGL